MVCQWAERKGYLSQKLDKSMICRVIGLESRQDRLEKIPEEMQRIGLPWQFFATIDPPGETDMMRIGSYSFIEVLKNFTGHLLVCESDVTFIYQAKEIFDKAVYQLPMDFDLLYLGGNIHEPAERFSENLFRIKKGVHCNHAILYSDSGRRKMIAMYDPLTNDNPRIDDWLYHIGQKEMNCFICSPMIAYQRVSYSDINKKVVDYYIEMRSHEIQFL
jgi:GR25 family glycosyltransferase involved in LPS biosynthesis